MEKTGSRCPAPPSARASAAPSSTARAAPSATACTTTIIKAATTAQVRREGDELLAECVRGKAAREKEMHLRAVQRMRQRELEEVIAPDVLKNRGSARRHR